MRKILLLLVALLFSFEALAADNAVILDPGSTITMRTKDVGTGVQSPYNILGDLTGTAIYGTAGTANTNVLTVQGIASGTAFNVNTHAVTQSGTWTVQPGNTANTTAWLVTGTGGTFPATQSGTWNITNISGTVSLPTGAATAANQATEIASLATIATNTGAAIPAGTATIGTVGQLPYPVGATPITASATGTTGATTATLAGTSGKTTYICGYSIRANATAATTVTNTITGVITATLSSIMWIAPAASGLGIDEQIFSPCIPASATNTGIAIVSGAPGTGGLVSSKGWGYQL